MAATQDALQRGFRVRCGLWLMVWLGMAIVVGQETAVAAGQASTLPAPLGVPHPGPQTEAPYAPQPIVAGGIVVPLYPPGSPMLNSQRVREPEHYGMSTAVPGRINSIVNIHNPSIEIHTVERGVNTGAVVILIAGGGHRTLNVGSESADFVPFFANYGVNTVILRNRLHSDGYEPQKDGVDDTLQAIRLVRAHAQELGFDPHKIGVMGFSAGGELAAAAAVFYPEIDQRVHAAAGSGTIDGANVSARPDFVALVYPGPSPFAKGAKPPIPRDMPPTFLISGGSGDQVHAVWADEYFAAMLAQSVPNLEMHIYAQGRHPGDPLPDGSHMNGGLSDRNNTPYGTWQIRFMDWFRDLGFLGKPGVETKAAADLRVYEQENAGKAQPAR